MENTTALLWRQEDVLAEKQVFVVEANDASLRDLPTQSLVIHSDWATIPAEQFQAWPIVPQSADLVIIILPKSRERLDFILAGLQASVKNAMEVWVVGPSKGGIRGALKQLKAVATDGEVEQIDNARRCRIYSIMLAPKTDMKMAQFAKVWQGNGQEFISYPGVFSHGRLDEGTQLLLSALPAALASKKVLDVGAGAGVISLALAQQGAQVTATDVSATAVAATQATLAHHGVSATVLGADLYGELNDRFDYIVTNPPFHEGINRTTGITERLIAQAPKYLLSGGELWMVANKGLPYEQWLQQAFAKVEQMVATNRFVVWRAVKG